MKTFLTLNIPLFAIGFWGGSVVWGWNWSDLAMFALVCFWFLCRRQQKGLDNG